jgi:uncharacterized damage-inducible protein DinB
MTDQEKKEAKPDRSPEPWLRGTHSEVPPIERAVLHSLEMAREDVTKWCGGLSDEELHLFLPSLPSVAFQLRHIARSLDRFLCYLDGKMLSAVQLQALSAEKEGAGSAEEIFAEFRHAVETTEQGIASRLGRPFDAPLKIGRKELPTTHGGLLVHLAEHTQRHVGQAVTTAKLIVSQRPAQRSGQGSGKYSGPGKASEGE